jgi:hypothetical protein
VCNKKYADVVNKDLCKKLFELYYVRVHLCLDVQFLEDEVKMPDTYL